MNNTQHKFTINQVVKYNLDFDRTKDNTHPTPHIAIITGVLIVSSGVRYESRTDRDGRQTFAEGAVMSVIKEDLVTT